jgi:basic amino acid/polyamine antiporter, APA family
MVSSVEHATPPSLIRVMGRVSLTAAIINDVIGSGIFGLPLAVAALTGAWSPLAVVVAGACVFLVRLCFAEVGSRFDQAGGPISRPARRSPWRSFFHWCCSLSQVCRN